MFEPTVTTMQYLKIVFVFLCLSPSCSKEYQSPAASPASSPAPTTEASDIIKHTLTSVHVNDEYPIYVYRPENYETTPAKLPTIYVLDGKSRFDLIVALIEELKIEAIVVGIANTEMRNRDYMPVNTCTPGGGGHTDYYKFLSNELIPFIDAEYKTDMTSRTLVGHSYSGAMTLIALFSDNRKQPLINSYIANDPSILCEPSFFISLFPEEDETQLTPTIKLHISKSYQNTVDLYIFATGLQAKKYPWLKLDWQEFKSEDHNSIVRPSFKAGLKFIFDM